MRPVSVAVAAGLIGAVGMAGMTLVDTTNPTTPLARNPQPLLISAPIIPMAQRDVASQTGLRLTGGATFDAAMSRTPGTGSVRLPGQYAQVISAPFAVVAGRTYTMSMFARSATATAGQITMYAYNSNSGGGDNPITRPQPDNPYLQDQSMSFQSVGLAGVWQEVASTFTSEETGYAAMLLTRSEPQFAGSGPMWIDDFAVFDGVGVQAIDPGPRTGFDGTLIQVSATGQFSLRGRPIFPNCVALNGSSDAVRTRAVAAGFNCNVWSYPTPTDLSRVKLDADAGLTSFMQVAQYLGRGDFAHNWSHLEQTINAINASPLSANVTGYWWDNEVGDSIENYRAMVATIRRADGGRRPIVMLHSHTYSRAFVDAAGVPLYDVMGSYYQGGQQAVNANVWFARPTTMCQMQAPGVTYRARMQQCLDGGGTMSSVFADGTGVGFGDPTNPPPVDQHGGWDDYPRVRAELAQLMATTPTTTTTVAPPTVVPTTSTTVAPTTVAPTTSTTSPCRQTAAQGVTVNGQKLVVSARVCPA